ncbi:MAG TPA: hypothetical protein VEI52_24570 [Terriglobales bacterium]|nr:hypothetical protein [Terriglobales bacterium]
MVGTLVVDVEEKLEEVPYRGAAAPRRTAVTGPRCTSRDIDVVVAGNLLARRNIAAGHEERAVALVEHIGIGVATVIDVSIRVAQ